VARPADRGGGMVDRSVQDGCGFAAMP